MFKFYDTRLPLNIFLSDFIFLNGALVIAHFLIFSSNDLNLASKIFFMLSNLCWVTMSLVNKNYRMPQPLNLNLIIDKFLLTLIYQSLVILSVIYFFKILNISRGFVLIGFAIFFLMIIIHRVLLYFFLRKNATGAQRKVTVLGNRRIADSLINIFSKFPVYKTIANEYISDEEIEKISFDGLLETLSGSKPDEIFVCYKEMNIESLDRLILFGETHDIKVRVVFDALNIENDDLSVYDNLPILHINTQPRVSAKLRLLKRVFDIFFSSIIMLAGAPAFVVLYVVTKTTSKGPALYKQERIGKDEKPFYIYKFRSMYIDSEKLGPQLARDNDPRITKWGRMIRKTRLDELPQFWNVLKGEMSIVGYRPERKHFIEEIAKKSPDYKKLFIHKPGITSMGQVHYGYAENVDQMCDRLRYDLLYCLNSDLNSDLNIILRTVRVMVKGKGK